jgi:hypothetical protein
VEIRYPHNVVQLTGYDGNAFAIIRRVAEGLRNAGIGKQEVEASLPRPSPAITTICLKPA